MNATDVLVMSVASYFVNMYFLGCLPFRIKINIEWNRQLDVNILVYPICGWKRFSAATSLYLRLGLNFYSKLFAFPNYYTNLCIGYS